MSLKSSLEYAGIILRRQLLVICEKNGLHKLLFEYIFNETVLATLPEVFTNVTSFSAFALYTSSQWLKSLDTFSQDILNWF